MNNHDDILKKSKEIYNSASQEHGHSSKAVLWADPQTQYIRFNEIIKYISLDENSSVLDIGCGNGELYKFLNFSGFKGSYTGFDINDSLLNQAKQRYKNIDVQNVDILNHTIDKKYDYVIVSGMFSSNYGQDMLWMYDMIKAMYNLTDKKVIINTISSYVNFQDEDIFYTDPTKLLDFTIKNLSPHVIIEHGAIPYNFTIVIDKSKQWQSINNER